MGRLRTRAAECPTSNGDAPAFIKGQHYTRAEIHDALGGSVVSCLPARGGRIVAACLSPSFSPQAPGVMLCGQGPRTRPVSDLLVRQGGPIPVFVKRGTHRWEYQGEHRVARSFTAGAEFDRGVQGSGRAPATVSHVILFEPVRSAPG